MLIRIRQVTYLRCRLMPASRGDQNGLKCVAVLLIAFLLGGHVLTLIIRVMYNAYILASSAPQQ